MKLVLGVTEAPYRSGKTTGAVAEALEKKYHLMQTFSEIYGSNIGSMLEEGIAGALETMLQGGAVNKHPFEAGCAKIENLFRQSLTIKAYDGLIPGVPTKASLEGISNRFKNPRYIVKRGKKIKRPSRPAFVDTGTLQRNFVAFVETE